MRNGDLNWIAAYIWGIADGVPRDLYVRGKYRDVILPMTIGCEADVVASRRRSGAVDSLSRSAQNHAHGGDCRGS